MTRHYKVSSPSVNVLYHTLRSNLVTQPLRKIEKSAADRQTNVDEPNPI